MRRSARGRTTAVVAVAAVALAAVGIVAWRAGDSEPAITAATTSTTTVDPVGDRDPRAVAAALAPLQLPSDCPLPLDDPVSLPNSTREYRAGVHGGIDFICGERGRTAVAALDGRVVLANAGFEDASPADRDALLEQARALGHTPPWTLAFLFGRFVVLDHGPIPGAGHVVTIYAHLDSIDRAVVPGALVSRGAPVGEIGNTGTETGASGGDRPQSIHLHWELHVDDVFLGAGLDAATTAEVYRTLFDG
jgi:murein DD-endopeptidase MepM/ murein hydrolase activator NlpD